MDQPEPLTQLRAPAESVSAVGLLGPMPVAGLALFASGSTHALTLSFWRDGSWVLRHLRDARRLAVRHCELADPPVEQPPEIFKLRLDPPVAAQRHVRLGRQLVERLPGRALAHHDRQRRIRDACWLLVA